MMAVAVDPATNTIPYEFFINQLMVGYLISHSHEAGEHNKVFNPQID